MITVEQKKEISLLLNGKNLPLDLKLEILDHMMEQVDYNMGFEGKDFSNALDEINASWSLDLKMKNSFIANGSRTNIHRETVYNSNIEILKKTTYYFIGFFLLSVFLLIFSKTVSYYFFLILYISVVATFLIIFIFDFKTMSTCKENDSKKISYLQSGAAKFTLASVFICFFVIYNFDQTFDNYYNGFHNLIQEFSFTQKFIGSFFLFYVYLFMWIFGFLNYLEYKKTLKYLEQKINFRL